MDRYDWKSLVDGRFNLSYFRSYGTDSSVLEFLSTFEERWGVRNDAGRATRESWGLERKITIFWNPTYFFNPTTRARKLVHPDYVHGQTLWQAEKAFDKPWKSSYNFSTRLFTSISSFCRVLRWSRWSLRRAEHHMSILF